MEPITDGQWSKILEFFADSSHVTASLRRSTPYCALATINADGSPRVTPISSLILGPDKNGFYCEEFSRHMAGNLERDPRVCLLVVNNRLWFWKKAVMLGRFTSPPAVRLFGRAGPRRAASEQELATFRRPLRPFRVFRGYKYMWGQMKHGRELSFHGFETVECGPMKTLQAIS